jgi:hypothetical protein
MSQIKKSEEANLHSRAEDLVRKTKISNIARLAKMLVDLFGMDEPFKKVGKLQGQEIELYLKELDGYITFVLSSDRVNFDCYVKKAENPKARILINVREDKIITVLSKIIRSKANLFGILKLLKYFISKQIIIKGNFIAALKLSKCLMIGKHDIYKKAKEGNINESKK